MEAKEEMMIPDAKPLFVAIEDLPEGQSA